MSRIKAGPGEHITDFVDRLVELAKQENREVAAVFNGVDLKVKPYSTVSEVLRQFDLGVYKRGQTVYAKVSVKIVGFELDVVEKELVIYLDEQWEKLPNPLHEELLSTGNKLMGLIELGDGWTPHFKHET